MSDVADEMVRRDTIRLLVCESIMEIAVREVILEDRLFGGPTGFTLEESASAVIFEALELLQQRAKAGLI